MAVNKITNSSRNKIISKSVNPLPNNPSKLGYSAQDIKNSMFKFVTDEEESIVAEINRIVDEANTSIETATEKYYSAEFLESDWEKVGNIVRINIPFSSHKITNPYIETMEIWNSEEGCWENNIPTWQVTPTDTIRIKADNAVKCKIIIKGDK